jgi:tetratricopeptide (TPR) repeat protein
VLFATLAARVGAQIPDDAAARREDLRALAEGISRLHPNPFHDVSREEWTRAVAALDAAAPSLDAEEFAVGLMRLVAKIGDGHTSLTPFFNGKLSFHAVGARVYAFSDGFFVRAADPAHRDLVGAKLVAVGGVPVDEAFRRVAESVPHDNDEGLKQVVPLYFGIPEILHGVGLGKADEAGWTLEKDGRRFEVVLPGIVALGVDGQGHGGGAVWSTPEGWLDARAASAAAPPLWLAHASELYAMNYLPDRRLLFVSYNAVANDPRDSVAAFFARVFRFAAEHPVDRFVLDIRNNSGGNNFLNAPIVRGLLRSHLDERGKLFVVLGRATFSAAQSLVNDLSRFAEPTFVGEPTGSRPSQYGDHDPLVLPRSGVVVMVSRIFWPDRTVDRRRWTAPDLAAPLSFADYRDGRDPALEAIESYRSIAQALALAVAAGDADAVEKRARAFPADPATAAAAERELNALGYRLLVEGRIPLAIVVFRANVERNPKSANACDSLGEAYLASRDFGRARDAYRQVLARDRANENATRMLRTIDEEEAKER